LYEFYTSGRKQVYLVLRFDSVSRIFTNCKMISSSIYSRTYNIHSCQKPDTVTKTILLDFLLPEQADWLDKSQAFLPFTGWFETGYKSIVDFPREHVLSFIDTQNAALNSTFDVGDVHSFLFRSLHVPYHGAVLSFRPFIWHLLKRQNVAAHFFRKRVMLSFGLKKRYGKHITRINAQLVYAKKPAFFSHVRGFANIKYYSHKKKLRRLRNRLKRRKHLTTSRNIQSYFEAKKRFVRATRRNELLYKFFHHQISLKLHFR
jgi:hypothetical protein